MEVINEYRNRVFATYKKKRNDGVLSLNLMEPAPARIRDECLHVYLERGCPKEDEALRLFFGPRGDDPDYCKLIRRSDADVFRPLVNYLKEITVSPEIKNIELLAWLISFEPRPFQFDFNNIPRTALVTSEGDGMLASKSCFGEGQTNNVDDKRNGESGNNEDGEHRNLISKPGNENIEKVSTSGRIEDVDDDSTPIDQVKNAPAVAEKVPLKSPASTAGKGIASKIKKPVIYVTVGMAVCVATYFATKSNDRQCMYWTGDSYVPISCNDTTVDAIKIALDENKVAGLKKITQPDTLTKNALGKVWYVKINADSAEFYTAAGLYPLDRDKILKPITMYILTKYILDKKNNPTISAP